MSAIASHQYWVLAAFIVVVFLIGGGARGDIASLMVLRPLAVAVAAYGLATVSRSQLRENGVAVGLALAAVLLHLVQLVPLPPALWSALPGRGPVADIGGLANLGAIWRPMTMTPAATGNALWSLSVPIAVLLLAIQLDFRQRTMLIPVLLGLCALGLSVGVLQIFGDPGGAFYFYRITNPGAVVGLFANRGHNALFLVIMLAILLVWSGGRAKRGFAETCSIAAAAALIVLQIMLTGSRTGAALGLLVILAAPFVRGYRPFSLKGAAAHAWAVSGGLLGLALLAFFTGRGLAIERIMTDGVGADTRFKALPTLVATVREYAPWGAGFGSFDRIFRIHEPRELIGPSYFNHAHNDWIELVLDGGVPAAVLLAVACLWLGRCIVRVFRSGTPGEMVLARLSTVILVIFALASLSDYPLRVPSLASLAIIACVWITSEKLPFDNKPVR